MGGMGSGRRRHYGARNTEEDCHSLDVRRLQRDGLLTPGRGFDWQWTRNGEVTVTISVKVEMGRVVLSYRHRNVGEEWESVEEPVLLDTTPCHYGGHRVWFSCPGVRCGRRVAILHGAGRYFACRICYRLAYASQREDAGDRALRRAQRIRKRLGGSANMMMPFPTKPKGMRWRTYERLRAVSEADCNRSLMALAERFNL